MITKSSLERAAEKNIIQVEQIESLYKFLHEQPEDNLADAREEPLRFIRSFGDVYITLGIIFLMFSIHLTDVSGSYFFLPAVGFVLLAEWLVRIRQLALPGMVILLSILYFVYRGITQGSDTTAIFGLSIVAVTSILFYLRYKMPFSHLPLTASLVAIFIIMLGGEAYKEPAVYAVTGLIVFMVAMWFDSRDTKRVSHLSDSAFWLHLLGAPLLVHGVMISLMSMSADSWSHIMPPELLILCVFAVFFLIAMLVDRRAILVSTQIYMIYTVGIIIVENVSGAGNVVMIGLITAAMFIIYFGAYWYKTRRFIYGFLSGKAITRYIPDLNIKDGKAYK